MKNRFYKTSVRNKNLKSLTSSNDLEFIIEGSIADTFDFDHFDFDAFEKATVKLGGDEFAFNSKKVKGQQLEIVLKNGSILTFEKTEESKKFVFHLKNNQTQNKLSDDERASHMAKFIKAFIVDGFKQKPPIKVFVISYTSEVYTAAIKKALQQEGFTLVNNKSELGTNDGTLELGCKPKNHK